MQNRSATPGPPEGTTALGQSWRRLYAQDLGIAPPASVAVLGRSLVYGSSACQHRETTLQSIWDRTPHYFSDPQFIVDIGPVP